MRARSVYPADRNSHQTSPPTPPLFGGASSSRYHCPFYCSIGADISLCQLLPLEELDRSFVLLGCLQCREGAQILALALLVFFARVEAVAAGRQFADHVPSSWRVMVTRPAR